MNIDKNLLKYYLKLYLDKQYQEYPEDSEDKVDYEFIEKYKIKELFLSILKEYKKDVHRSNLVTSFRYILNSWNYFFPNYLVSEDDLLKKNYFLNIENRICINPFASKTDNSNESKFYEYFDKYKYFHPLFDIDYIDVVITGHNVKYELDLSEKLLLGDNNNLHDAIFRNYKGEKFEFISAIIEFLNSKTYSDWKDEMENIFYLLTDLETLQIPFGKVLKSLNKNKISFLIGYFIIQLSSSNNWIGKFNQDYFSSLRFDTSIPISRESNKNIFAHIKDDSIYFQSFADRNLLHFIFSNFDFYFFYLLEYFSTENLNAIIEILNSEYLYQIFSKNLLNYPEKCFEIKSLKIAPHIILGILQMNEPYYLRNSSINFTETKTTLIISYVDFVNNESEEYLEFLMDFYFYLPTRKSLYNLNFEIEVIIREYVMKIILNLIKNKFINYDFIKRFETISVKDDFKVYDILIDFETNNFNSIIIESYKNLISNEEFFDPFFKINGINNLLSTLAKLQETEITKLKIDFISKYSTLKESTSYSERYNLGKRLRLHLGILCLLLESNFDFNFKNDLIDYILNSFSTIKEMDMGENNPLDWYNILHDNIFFDIYDYSLNKNEILTFHVLKILTEFKNKDEQINFFKNLKSKLTFSEMVLFKECLGQDIVNDEDLNMKDNIENIALGWAKKEAFFLVRSNYFKEGLKYIEHISDLNKIDDQLLTLKLEALINLKDFENAEKCLSEFSNKDKDNVMTWMGLIYFFKKDFENAENQFANYLSRNTPSIFELVNYSATLIMRNKNDEAVKLIEENISRYKNEYLLSLNLGAAYAKIDTIKSLFYLQAAKNIKPDSNQINADILYGIISLKPEIQKMFEELKLDTNKINIAHEYINSSQDTIMKLLPEKPGTDEMEIITEIFSAINNLEKNPYFLEKHFENDISDSLRNILTGSLKRFNLIVERELPQGYANKKVGENDLVIYSSLSPEKIITIGENKEWSKTNFESQLKQLIGYMNEGVKFGFTIVFNKRVDLSKINKEREDILNNFSVVENNIKYFEKKYPTYSCENIGFEVTNVLLSLHENPEIPGTYFRLYHFVVNSNRGIRKESAKQARKK